MYVNEITGFKKQQKQVYITPCIKGMYSWSWESRRYSGMWRTLYSNEYTSPWYIRT